MAKKCDLCGVQDAAYVCRTCGRNLCASCFRPYTWKCVECDGGVAPARVQPVMSISTWLLFAGVAVIFVGMILAALGSLVEGGVSFGGIFLIGPIPIILGAGPLSFWLVVLGAVITLAALSFYWIRRRKMEEAVLE